MLLENLKEGGFTSAQPPSKTVWADLMSLAGTQQYFPVLSQFGNRENSCISISLFEMALIIKNQTW